MELELNDKVSIIRANEHHLMLGRLEQLARFRRFVADDADLDASVTQQVETRRLISLLCDLIQELAQCQKVRDALHDAAKNLSRHADKTYCEDARTE